MIELDGKKFFTKKEVCERLKMNLSTLNNKVCKYKIKGVRFGRFMYYTESDMIDIVDPEGTIYRFLTRAVEQADNTEPENLAGIDPKPAPKRKPRKSKAKATKGKTAPGWEAMLNNDWNACPEIKGEPIAPGWDKGVSIAPGWDKEADKD